MNLDGIAGRALGQRLNGSRERKRAADNDNRQPEAAPGGVALGERNGCDGGATTPVTSPQRGRPSRETRQHVGGLE